MEEEFHGNFRVSFTGFLPFPQSPLLNRAYLVWFERSLHPAQSCPLPSTIKMPITVTFTCLSVFLVEISMLGASLFVWRHKILLPGQAGSLT